MPFFGQLAGFSFIFTVVMAERLNLPHCGYVIFWLEFGYTGKLRWSSFVLHIIYSVLWVLTWKLKLCKEFIHHREFKNLTFFLTLYFNNTYPLRKMQKLLKVIKWRINCSFLSPLTPKSPFLKVITAIMSWVFQKMFCSYTRMLAYFYLTAAFHLRDCIFYKLFWTLILSFSNVSWQSFHFIMNSFFSLFLMTAWYSDIWITHNLWK